MTDQELDKKMSGVFFNITCAIFVFILYASLLPFNIVANSSELSFLDYVSVLKLSSLNVAQGQWIGHVIFNVLLTFSASLYCSLHKYRMTWVIIYLSIVIFGFSVEFFQMFVSSRGTSLVDIYANLGGMLVGFILWAMFGKFTLNALRHYLLHETLTIDFVKKLYLAFVIIIVLFPFDFYINKLQFQVGFATKEIFALGSDFVSVSSLASVLLLIPLGILYQMSAQRKKVIKKSLLFKYSIILLALELMQFFEISGQSSFISFFCKYIGFIAGLYIGKFLSLKLILHTVVKFRHILLLFLPLFLWAALKLKGFSMNAGISLSDVATVIENTSLLPFYYYVEVGSAEALLSFLFNFIIFLPLGGIYAIYKISKRNDSEQLFFNLFIIGIVIAVLLEITVLLWGLKRPDVTNILVSAIALPLGYYFSIMMNKATQNNAIA